MLIEHILLREKIHRRTESPVIDRLSELVSQFLGASITRSNTHSLTHQLARSKAVRQKAGFHYEANESAKKFSFCRLLVARSDKRADGRTRCTSTEQGSLTVTLTRPTDRLLGTEADWQATMIFKC